MSARRQHVVLCEGFDDRSFWAGWLLRLGCEDPSKGGRKTAYDKWGHPIRGRGRFAFTTPAGSCIVVHPFGGRRNLRAALREYLAGQPYRPDRMIVNLDSDSENGSEDAHKAIRDSVQAHGDTEESSDGLVFDGIEIGSVIWQCAESPGPGSPRKQTLERLVSTAIEKAHPGRGEAVAAWLEAEPAMPARIPKNFTYSYLAKWYAEFGADDFFRALWRDEPTAEQLRRMLEETGGWRIVAAMVGE